MAAGSLLTSSTPTGPMLSKGRSGVSRVRARTCQPSASNRLAVAVPLVASGTYRQDELAIRP